MDLADASLVAAAERLGADRVLTLDRRDFETCLTGGLRLVPNAAALPALAADHRGMIDAGMFIGDPPQFGEIVERLSALEATINQQHRR